VQKEPEITIGTVIKPIRQQADITMERLAERTGITERYLYRIENEGKNPSFDVLYKLIRELGIDPNLIFYPEKEQKNTELESLVHMLYQCDERALEVIKATVKALIDSRPEEN